MFPHTIKRRPHPPLYAYLWNTICNDSLIVSYGDMLPRSWTTTINLHHRRFMGISSIRTARLADHNSCLLEQLPCFDVSNQLHMSEPNTIWARLPSIIHTHTHIHTIIIHVCVDTHTFTLCRYVFLCWEQLARVIFNWKATQSQRAVTYEIGEGVNGAEGCQSLNSKWVTLRCRMDRRLMPWWNKYTSFWHNWCYFIDPNNMRP